MANLMTWRPIMGCAAALTLLFSACDSVQPLGADAAQTDVMEDGALPGDTLGVADAELDASSKPDGMPLEDAKPTDDGAESTDIAELDAISPPDLGAPDTMEEDLSDVDVTWTKDIEYIATSQCENCHGVAGGSGLKLYTRQQWIDYFPMIVPSLETGKMPKTGSLAPGQLELVKLWGKVGYPE